MPELVAIDLPTGPAFVDALRRVWDAGDAAVPLDPRLPAPAARALLDALAPSAVIDGTGSSDRTSRAGGRPVDDGDALVVATSGTTGDPKGVVLTHAAVRASASATSTRLGVDPSRDRWLAALPVAHIGGLAVVTRSLITGTPLTFDPDDPEATLTALVPTQLERLDTSRFRVVLAGGSADWRSGERDTNIVHTYGMTETGSGVVYAGEPLDGVDVRLDDGGQILVRGPMLLRSYRDGAVPVDADGWLATGDEGEFESGLLRVHGRRGDVVVTGGEKVWPAPVEAVLRRHPAVADVAVAGVADAEWGQSVVAYVVPSDGARPPALDDLRAWVKDSLPAYAAPRAMRLLGDLPRTPSGKVRRDALAGVTGVS